MNYPQENIKPYDSKENKGKQVEKMFDNIACAYDKLNHTLSFGIDKIWRRKAISYLRPFVPKKMMDLATGTGDFAIQAYKMLKPEELLATDISEGMMSIGQEKINKLGLSDYIKFKKEDCCSLSFENDCFDAITVAFGIRNFEDLDKGLSEIYRVLKKDGHLVILELSEPKTFPMKQLYSIYSRIVIPTIGKILSNDNNAYTYLPESIKAFPQGEVMSKIIQKAGFPKVEFKRLTFGTCTLYMASK